MTKQVAEWTSVDVRLDTTPFDTLAVGQMFHYGGSCFQKVGSSLARSETETFPFPPSRHVYADHTLPPSPGAMPRPVIPFTGDGRGIPRDRNREPVPFSRIQIDQVFVHRNVVYQKRSYESAMGPEGSIAFEKHVRVIPGNVMEKPIGRSL